MILNLSSSDGRASICSIGTPVTPPISASCALIPKSATEPKDTVAASREEVKATLAALKEMPLERAVIALVAFTGVRPSEARGLRWEEWNREQQHIAVQRRVWWLVRSALKALLLNL